VRGLIVAARGRAERPLDAPVTIAADGRRSTVALGLHLLRHPARPRRWAIGQYFDGVTGLTRFGEMHVRDRWYVGVAPVPDGLVNVCVVTDRAGGPGTLGDPAGFVRSVVDADPDLRERFADARPVTPPSVIGPLAVDARAAGMPGLLLAGDAAGFIDPITGDGLRFAIRGAELAADAALEMLAGKPTAHLDLATRRSREFSRKWRFNRTLRVVVDSVRSKRAMAFAAARVPRLVEHLVTIAGDVPA
jgi:flavin-dependent dehydrogenase